MLATFNSLLSIHEETASYICTGKTHSHFQHPWHTERCPASRTVDGSLRIMRSHRCSMTFSSRRQLSRLNLFRYIQYRKRYRYSLRRTFRYFQTARLIYSRCIACHHLSLSTLFHIYTPSLHGHSSILSILRNRLLLHALSDTRGTFGMMLAERSPHELFEPESTGSHST